MMKAGRTKWMAVLALFFWAALCLDAEELRGAGDNFGSGWRKDSQGNWVGTGKNFGKTWRQQ
jgi:hypothetical protein